MCCRLYLDAHFLGLRRRHRYLADAQRFLSREGYGGLAYDGLANCVSHSLSGGGGDKERRRLDKGQEATEAREEVLRREK